MSNTVNDTDQVGFDVDNLSGNEDAYALLTLTAQQAVLPRALDEGIYSVLDKHGAVKIVETPGYTQRREFKWQQDRSGKPEFVVRDVTLLDTDSFIDYLRENTKSVEPDHVDAQEYVHGTGLLELWGSVDDRRIHAILDGYDGHRQHNAYLKLKTSREWDEWRQIDGKLMPQAQFAEFITDHISTIGKPDGALLVDICETLIGSTNVQWRSQQLAKNGQRQFVYEEIVDGQAGAKGDLAIPTELMLVLRPFQGSPYVSLKANFRFRLNGGAVQFGVKLVEPEKILENSFTDIVNEVQDRVPVHVRIGRP